MSPPDGPQPIRGSMGATDPGPRNVELDRQNPDILVPPETDNGSFPNLKFSFSLAHNRLEDGGWAREVTVRDLPVATAMAGVNMRLGPGVVRELHWHKEAEWGYVTQGRVRVTVVDVDRSVFVDDLQEGDVWLFPAGIPHSIQGLEEGCEFLLVFDDGKFSEYQTMLITEWFAHTPRDVLAKNFGVAESCFANIPKKSTSSGWKSHRRSRRCASDCRTISRSRRLPGMRRRRSRTVMTAARPKSSTSTISRGRRCPR